MKENYKAWDIKIDDFYKITDEKEKLKFLLNFAVLAPSSHNSQPWKFKFNSNSIEVFLDEKRKLIHADKNNRQAYISIGCAIENIKIAANYFGWETRIILPEDQLDDYLTIINLESKISNIVSQPDNLIFSISKRVTNRNKYSKNLPPVDFISKIKAYSNNEIKVFVVTDKKKINQISDVVLNASVVSMESKDFRRELSQYVKNNLTNSSLGIPAFSMAIPTPVSFFVPTILKHLNMAKLSRKGDEKLLKENTPIMVVIATEKDNKKQWIQSGRIYENIALESTRNGVSTSIWGAPIETGNFYKDLQNILSTNFRPQIFFRVGYSNKSVHKSPRIHMYKVLRD